MFSFIILILVLIAIYKWLPSLALFFGVLIAFPIIPYIIAYNIKDVKPKTAMALRVLWTSVFILLTISFLLS